jgi:hypothetical protein
VKKYVSGVDGRRHRLQPEFNESTPTGRHAVPEEAAPPKRERRWHELPLTPDLCDRICAGITKGLFPTEAAKLAGVHV